MEMGKTTASSSRSFFDWYGNAPVKTGHANAGHPTCSNKASECVDTFRYSCSGSGF